MQCDGKVIQQTNDRSEAKADSSMVSKLLHPCLAGAVYCQTDCSLPLHALLLLLHLKRQELPQLFLWFIHVLEKTLTFSIQTLLRERTKTIRRDCDKGERT